MRLHTDVIVLLDKLILFCVFCVDKLDTFTKVRRTLVNVSNLYDYLRLIAAFGSPILLVLVMAQ
jgi:hypothetical protein